MKFEKFNKKIFLTFSIIIFRSSLDLTYIFFVNPYYEHMGFYLNISIQNYLLSWCFVYLFSLIASPEINKPSDYFFMMAGLTLLLPLTSLYGLANRPIQPVIVTTASLFCIHLILKLSIPIRIKPLHIKNGRSIALWISIVFIITLIFWYFISGAYKYINLSFSKVYEVRSLSAQLANVNVMAYITGWTYKVFLIFALSYALLKKNFGCVFILIVIQVFYYSVSAHKSVLFTPFVVIGVWLYLKRFKTLLIMPIGFTSIIIISYFFYIAFNNIMIPSIFIRRVFFVPAQLSFDYFEFFNKNELVLWSNSILSNFKTYPYHLPLPKLIGEYNGSGASANNGLISSGFAHWGYYGVIFYSLLFGLILRILDYASYYGLPIWFVLAMTITPLRDALISSDLFTTLLTHGLLVALFLLLLSIEKKVPHEK